jgi:hypothetical protein
VRLPGYLDERFTPPAPSIYSQIETRVIEGRQNLSFLIDTGASATTILDPDLERLGINWNNLAKAPRPLGGIGGTVETRLIEDGRLLFTTGSGETAVEKLTIHVAKHDQARLDRPGKQLVMQLPCLLGRDILQHYRVVYDRPRRQVYLEK